MNTELSLIEKSFLKALENIKSCNDNYWCIKDRALAIIKGFGGTNIFDLYVKLLNTDPDGSDIQSLKDFISKYGEFIFDNIVKPVRKCFISDQVFIRKALMLFNKKDVPGLKATLCTFYQDRLMDSARSKTLRKYTTLVDHINSFS